jgi:hypothetical protein
MKKSTNGFSSVVAQQKHKILFEYFQKKKQIEIIVYMAKSILGNRQPEGILDIKLQLQQIIILSF